MIMKGKIMLKKVILTICLILFSFNLIAKENTYKMVFVPASEKGDESDYTNLIAITQKLTGLNIDIIKVTDYNAAVEAIRAGRAHIAWYGGKTYVKASEIANAEAFAAGVRPGEKMSEILITKDESKNTLEYKNHYVINSEIFGSHNKNKYKLKDFEYNSSTNKNFLDDKKVKILCDKLKLI